MSLHYLLVSADDAQPSSKQEIRKPSIKWYLTFSLSK